MKKTIAMKGFIAEFGEIFSEKMKKKIIRVRNKNCTHSKRT